MTFPTVGFHLLRFICFSRRLDLEPPSHSQSVQEGLNPQHPPLPLHLLLKGSWRRFLWKKNLPQTEQINPKWLVSGTSELADAEEQWSIRHRGRATTAPVPAVCLNSPVQPNCRDVCLPMGLARGTVGAFHLQPTPLSHLSPSTPPILQTIRPHVFQESRFPGNRAEGGVPLGSARLRWV